MNFYGILYDWYYRGRLVALLLYQNLTFIIFILRLQQRRGNNCTLTFITRDLRFLLFRRMDSLVTLGITVSLLRVDVAHRGSGVFYRFMIRLKDIAFGQFAIVLRLMRHYQFAMTIGRFFALFTTQANGSRFINVGFSNTLNSSSVANGNGRITLRVGELLIQFGISQLVDISNCNGYQGTNNRG